MVISQIFVSWHIKCGCREIFLIVFLSVTFCFDTFLILLLFLCQSQNLTETNGPWSPASAYWYSGVEIAATVFHYSSYNKMPDGIVNLMIILNELVCMTFMLFNCSVLRMISGGKTVWILYETLKKLS